MDSTTYINLISRIGMSGMPENQRMVIISLLSGGVVQTFNKKITNSNIDYRILIDVATLEEIKKNIKHYIDNTNISLPINSWL